MSEGTSGETVVIESGVKSNIGGISMTEDEVEIFPEGRVIGGPLSSEFEFAQRFRSRMKDDE